MTKNIEPAALEVTTTIEPKTFFKNVGGKAQHLDWSVIPASMIGVIAQKACLVVLNNAYNSMKGTEEQKLTQAMKRFDAWSRGSWEIVDRASSQATLMREAYYAEIRELHPTVTDKALDAKIKATVKKVLGDVNATFDNFLEALAIAKADGDEAKAATIKAALVEKYEAAAAKLEADRASAADAIDIDLTDFEI